MFGLLFLFFCIVLNLQSDSTSRRKAQRGGRGFPNANVSERWGFHGSAPQVQVVLLAKQVTLDQKKQNKLYVWSAFSILMEITPNFVNAKHLPFCTTWIWEKKSFGAKQSS